MLQRRSDARSRARHGVGPHQRALACPAAGFAAYDDAVPHPSPDAELAARFAELRRRRAISSGGMPDLHAVREVVVVVSSSRGGSSHFGALLRRCPGLLTLPAEFNPLVVIAQLGRPELRAATLADELALQIGRFAQHVDDEPFLERLTLDVQWRLTAQWPRVELSSEMIARATREVFACLRAEGLPPSTPPKPEAFTRRLLERLQRFAPELDPRRYDLPRDAAAPADPPSSPVVEMPPYVPMPIWQGASRAELERQPVVLTTPRLCWRLPAVRALFPRARVRLLHLVRNPGAAINGLMDAWLHPGFFNLPLPSRLRIAGYSDRFPAWGERWWKLDVPPCWRSLVDRPLPEVAAAQWREAHQAVLDDETNSRAQLHRIRHEDLVGPPERAERVARDLAQWLGIDEDAVARVVREGIAPVMATVPPAPGRWRRRMSDLAAVLGDPRVRELAAQLGYGPDPARWP